MIGLGFSVVRKRLLAIVEPILAGIFSSAQARLDVITHVSGTTNSPVRTASGYDLTSLSQVSMTVPAMSGTIWVASHLVKDNEESGAGWKFRGLTPTYDPSPTRTRSGQQVFKLPANTGSVTLNLSAGTNLTGDLRSVQAVQMESVLAQPWDVYVCMGQSQMAATTNALGIDWAQDSWSDPRLLYVPGSTYTGHGTTLGTIDALRAPLQANSEAVSGGALTANMRSNGVSPAISFAKKVLESTSAGRNVVVVQAAVSSTNLVGASGAWNPAGTTPFAYNHAVSMINSTMTAAPVGSKIKGVLWCQGESDSGQLASYASAWGAMRTAFETTWTTNSWTDSPVVWVIGTTPPDAVAATTASFITTQLEMDYQSGHANSKARCRVVQRTAGVEADGVHATASSNRELGINMANRLLAPT